MPEKDVNTQPIATALAAAPSEVVNSTTALAQAVAVGDSGTELAAADVSEDQFWSIFKLKGDSRLTAHRNILKPNPNGERMSERQLKMVDRAHAAVFPDGPKPNGTREFVKLLTELVMKMVAGLPGNEADLGSMALARHEDVAIAHSVGEPPDNVKLHGQIHVAISFTRPRAVASSVCLLVQAWERPADLRAQWVELATYMAIVREKRCGYYTMQDLYGLLTDGYRFLFFRLAKDGYLTRSEELTWKDDPNAIFGMIGDALWNGREVAVECGKLYPKLKEENLDDDLGTFKVGDGKRFGDLLFCYAPKDKVVDVKKV